MDLDLPYEFKSKENLVGMAVMKNKLKFESEYNGKLSETRMIVDEFKGDLLSVAFRKSDQYFVVPFPVSVLGVNSKGEATRQYLISMQYAIDDADEKLKREGAAKIVKFSPVVVPSLQL